MRTGSLFDVLGCPSDPGRPGDRLPVRFLSAKRSIRVLLSLKNHFFSFFFQMIPIICHNFRFRGPN